MNKLIFLFLWFLLTCSASVCAGPVSDLSGLSKAMDKARFTEANRRIKFTENKGQITDVTGNLSPDILFVSKGLDVNVYLTRHGLNYVWLKEEKEPEIHPATEPSVKNHTEPASPVTAYQMNMELLEANPNARIHRMEPITETENYYLAHSAQKGITHVSSYQKIRYEEIYPFIDFVVYSHEKGLKYDFIVKPGGNIADIKMRYHGSTAIKVLADGSLKVKNPLGILTEGKPFAYVLQANQNKMVRCSYKLDNTTISFNTTSFHSFDTLVIDPAVTWATYYGGPNADKGTSITTDVDGNIYMSGETASTSGISSAGFQNTLSGTTDAFLVKFNANGERQWATYYGGTGNETGRNAITDPAGNIYLIGQTSSSSGIASGGFQNTLSGTTDAFLVKFNANGERQWATYYGGEINEIGTGVGIDEDGNIYLSGQTNSTSGISFNGHQNTFGGGLELDAFLVKFNANGERQWATYYGGTTRDVAEGITIDKNNNIYVAGFTASANNISFNGHQNTFGGGWDAFLVKFNSAGARQWATYYGKSANDYGVAPAIDLSGNVYLAGQTASTTGIASGGYKNTFAGTWDAFLVKFNSAGARQWGTYYGGTNGDKFNSVGIDGNGNIFAAGETASTNHISYKGNQNTYGGGTSDAFLVKFNPAGARPWATYYGGNGSDLAYGVVTDAIGDIYLAGQTASTNNISVKGIQNTLAGDTDAFVSRISALPPLVTVFAPADDATDALPGSNLSITFNEEVQAGTGKFSIFQNNVLFDEVNVKSSFVTFDNATITIDPKKDFAPEASIYVLMPIGTIADTHGNEFPGISDPATWNFKTAADDIAPTVSTYSPIDEAANVAVDTDLTLVFDEAIAKGTGDILIKQGDNVLQTLAVTDASVVITDNTVTIDAPADLPSQTGIHIEIVGGAFTDIAGNNYAGITDATTWNFTTQDLTAPTISDYTPADEATGVPIDTDLTLTFSEAIAKGTGDILIKQGNTVLQTIAVTDASVTIAGNTVTIDPVDFPNEADIHIEIAAGAFKDLSDNNFAGITNATTWNFTTIAPADNTPPTVSTYTPNDEAANVAVNTNLALTFSEAIAKGTGDILIKQGNAVLQTIAVTDAIVSITGNTVTIDAPADLPNAAGIHIEIAAGAFKDLSDNNFSGITDATTWNFTTIPPADNTPPTVSTYAPTDDATNIAVDTDLILTFSEDVVKGTGDIVLKQGNNVLQTLAVTDALVSITGNTVTINPPANLPSQTGIHVEIAAGAFTDIAGNNFSGITDATTWNFTTQDLTAPTITVFSPADGAIFVANNTNLTLTFSEAIERGTGNITISQGLTSQVIDVTDNDAITIAGNTVVINPPDNFPFLAIISVQIPVGIFKDAAGNNFAGIADATTWNFTTLDLVDITPPIVSTYAPTDDATNIAINTNLVLTFSEDIKKGTGDILIKQGNNVLQTIAVTDAAVSVLNNTVTIDAPADLPSQTGIHIEIVGGAFTDIAGNNYAGITDATTWNFTTQDLTAPIISDYTPADEATDIDIDIDLTITFSEDIKKGTGDILIKEGNTVLQTIAVTDAFVTIAGNTVTIDPPVDLPNQAGIHIEITTGTFKDLSDNNFAGITDATTWNFTTIAPADNTPPTITAYTPNDEADNVAINTDLVLIFSENVAKGTGDILIKQGNAVLQTIAITDAIVSIAGNTVTIDAPADLPSQTGIHIEIAAGAFTDIAGNNYAGITDATTWNFTTQDLTAPIISIVSPVDEATDVAIDTDLTITFDEAIVKGTGDILIKEGNTILQTIAVTDAMVSITANTVTINPPVDLPNETNIHIEISAGTFTDIAGNNYAGITNATTWNFTTIAPDDNIAPTITAFTPADEQTDVTIDANLALIFSEDITKGTGDILIKQGNAILQTIDVNNAIVTVVGNTVTINPADLPNETNIHIEIADGAFKDLAGNDFSGITDATTWNFTTQDNTVPTVSTYTPADEAIDVAVDNNLVLTFDEAIVKGTGNILIKEGNTVLQTIAVTDAMVSITANTVTIDPPTDLPNETIIHIEIAAGAFTDIAGNDFSGIIDATTWNFTTIPAADNTPPTVSTYAPTDEATDVDIDTDLTITFDEAIAKGTGDILIKQGNTVLQTIAVTNAVVTITGNTVTIDPVDFPNEADIHIEIAAGAFTDLANNNYVGITNATTWNFTTIAPVDNMPPTVTAYTPNDETVNVAINTDLVLIFSENVAKGTGDILIKQGNTVLQTIAVTNAAVTISGSTVTIDPPTDFPNETDIHIEIAIGAFTDIAGNNYAGITDATTWNFTTIPAVDITPPTVTAYTPNDDAANVTIDANLALIFSEDIKKGTGDILIKQGNAVLQTIAVTDAIVSITGNTVTIDAPADLPSQTGIHIEIAAGTFTDIAGNDFSGITDATTWNFTTLPAVDITPPTVIDFLPLDEATDVAINTNLELTFSENIAKGTGDILIKQGITVLQTIDVNNAIVTVVGNTVTINPADFPNEAAIHIEIAAGAFTDIAGNDFSGITDATTWNFTTLDLVDITPPIVSTYAPTDDATNIAVNTNLVLTFSEDVKKGTGDIVLKQGNNVLQTIAVTDALVSITGNTVTLNPPADLPSQTGIHIEIAAGAFTDIAGNNYAGITDATTWNFTTLDLVDITPPTVTAYTPNDETVNVAVNTNLVVTFSEDVVKGTGDILIKQGNAVLQTIAVTDASVTITGNTVTIDPPTDLPNAAGIHIEIAAGAFKDLTGNNYAGITDATTWNFTTIPAADNTSPTVTAYTPNDGATDVPIGVNLALTFSEDIQKGTGDIVLKQGNTVLQTIAVTDASVTIAGNTVTINPPADLPNEADIYIEIAAGAFKDLAGNDFAGISDATTWNFTTVAPVDNTPPTVTTFSPADEETEVAIDANLVLIFSENVEKGTGDILIKQGNTTLQTIDVTNAAVTISNNTVTVDPAIAFPNEAGIHIEIAPGAFTDIAGNGFAGITDATTWNFTTIAPDDNIAPVVINTDPLDEAVDIVNTTNLVITFDEDVVKGTGNITLSQGNTVLQTIDVTSAAVTISGSVVTINPPADFQASAQITVQMPAGTFKDETGNNAAIITWNFTIAAPADNIPPTVTTLSPADGVTGVTVNANLLVTFSEEIQKGTGNITITQGASTQIIDVTDATVIIQGNTVTINPPDDLPAGTNVSVQIPAAVFEDKAGNPYAGITNATTWNFTVASPADNIPPTATTFSPADNAFNVAVNSNLVITFSEEIKKGSGNIIINQGNTTQTINVNSNFVTVLGNTATIDPPDDFPSGTIVNILMLSGVFTDLANNSYTGIDDASVWNFSVPDNIAPAIISFYPLDNTTDVPANINLIMIFNEAIKKGTGNITITRVGTTQTQVIDVTSAFVTVSGTTVIINPLVNFPAGTTISIQMPPGVFTDIAGNAYAGIIDATAWTLTISGAADNTPPVITSLLPADNATKVAASANLVLTFNENIQKGTGNITINQGNTTQTIAVSSDAVTIDGNTITIDPPADFPEGAPVYVQIPNTVFSDISNNAFAGITNTTAWNFTVDNSTPSDNTPPAISILSPADNATNVAVNANLVITFNEAVKKGTGIITITQENASQSINITSNNVTVNGSVVTINSQVNFPANRAISIQISAGGFKDISDNDFEGIANTTSWNFTTATPTDNIAPTTIAFSPPDNATNVAATANLVVTFSENIQKGTGNITINQGATTQTIAISSNAVTIAGNKITINPPADFPASAAVNIQMPVGSFKDLAGNNFAGITDATTWNFTIIAPADNTPPTVSTYVPADESNNIAIDVNLALTFSEEIKKGTGNITIRQGNTVLQTIAVSNAAVTVAGKTVTINPPADLPNEADIYIEIAAGAFKDLSDNNYAGISDATTWNFTTIAPADNTPPTVVTFSPADNATNVAINTNLVLTFDENVAKGTGDIVLKNGNTVLQTINVTNKAVTVADKIVTIDLPTDLPNATGVSIQIIAGVFKDVAGNNFAGITNATTWNFTTVAPDDNIAPTVTTYAPTDEETDVAINTGLVLTFSENIVKGTGNILLKQGNTLLQTINVTNAAVVITDDIVTINPATDLPNETDIHIEIAAGAFTDLAGNDYAGIADATTWNFTTVAPLDQTPPIVTDYSPNDEATDVAINTDLVLIFSENVAKGTGDILIKQGNTVLQTIAVTNAVVTISGSTVTIDPVDLPNETDIHIEISAGTFTDIAGNNFSGITDANTWNFTTIAPDDNTAPTITAFTPADGQTDVAIDENLELTFNEAILKGAGNILIKQGNTILQTIPVTNTAVTVSGSIVTINPPTDLPNETNIHIEIEQGAFKDLAGNDYAGITNATTWNFATIAPDDNTPPTVIDFLPLDEATDVAINTNLELTFSENIAKGTGDIVIKQGITVLQTIAITNAAIAVSGNTVTINPPVNLPNEADIHIEITAGAFKDATGNNYAGITNSTTWNFTTIAPDDNISPTITAFTPADGQTDVALNENLELTFDEAVVKGAGNILIKQGNNILQTIDVTNTAVTVSGSIVTINPPTDFPEEAGIHIEIAAGAFTDLAGNNFSGITDVTTWNFTTIAPDDNIAPQILSFNPVDNAADVAINTNLVITFDEAVVKGTGNITVNQGNTVLQTIAVTNAAINVNGASVSINPPANLPAGTAISIKINSGTFKDAAGNDFAGITDATTWNFTTAGSSDNTAPVVTALSPANDATNVTANANLVITFNENIQKGTGNITINQGNNSQIIDISNAVVSISGNTVTINPPANFPASATITVTIPNGAFTDQAGNNFAGIAATDWSFTIVTPADNTAPKVVTFSPADNAVNVAANVNLEITFDENIKKGTGNIIITEGANSQTIAVTDNIISVAGTKATINLASNFAPGASISILVETGAFTDIAGNDFAGITNSTTWNFTIATPVDNTPPVISSLAPADNATNIAANTNLVITFNEPVQKGTGNIVINLGANTQTIAVTNNVVTVAGNTVTINPTTDFPLNTVVNVQMAQGVFKDIAGNNFVGITNATTWNFTVAAPVDNVAPTITALSPPDDATDIAANTNLVITFNEPVQKGSGNIIINQDATSQTIAITSANVTVAGNTITINPAADFPLGTAIDVQIPAGVITDIAGNNFAGITTATAWNFNTIAPVDNTPPTISSLSPADNATDIADNVNLVLVFNENVKKGTGDIIINQGASSQTIAITSANVTVSGATITINPAADFPLGAIVGVEIPEGTITDLAGNSYEGIDATQWSFTIVSPVDNTAPLLSAVSPPDGAVNVAANINLVMTFNEEVKKGTGNIIISQNGTTQVISVADASVTVSGKNVTINPSVDFTLSATVTVQMGTGVITDIAGNPYAGIQASNWGFTIIAPADNTPPTVTVFSPANTATNVALNTNLVITFNEDIQKGAGTILIKQGNNILQSIDVTDASVAIASNIVTINPATDLPSGTAISVQMNAGIFTDLAGNHFAGINDPDTWNFTTIAPTDNKAPLITTVTPADNSIDVVNNQDLVIVFDEPVEKGTGTIIITHGNTTQSIDVTSSAVTIAGENVTINPPEDFPSGASVSILMLPGVFTDLAGNSFAGITDASTWNFTIIDNIAPATVSVFPADDSTNVPANTNLVMSFSEKIKKGSGKITITQGSSTQVIDVNDPAVIVSGATVIINPPADFPFNAAVHIEMPSGVFTDLAGNAYAGITQATAWNLNIAGFIDTTPPLVVSLSPADNTRGVQANTDLVLVFSENIQKGKGSITINQGKSPLTLQTLDVNSPEVSISGTTVTINMRSDFPLGADVHVIITKGSFTDLSNNPYAGISESNVWNFTIDASVPVEIISENFPEVILSTAAATDASIVVNRIPDGTTVEFVSRGIARKTWNRKPLASNSLTFAASMAQAQFDEIGLEYYFDITLASGSKIASDTGYTYIQYTGTGLDIPRLKFGATVNAYQIISVPLELKNKEASAVLEDNLGEYNIKKWRLFNYQSDILQEYKSGMNTIESGSGYWLIIKDSANINTGEGTTLKVHQHNPYTMRLKRGWNQIGNPYNFNVSWADVDQANNNPEGLGNLRLFEDEFLDSDVLKKFRGAFVFAESDMSIQIPVLKNETANNRVSAENGTPFNPSSLWEINFALRSKEMAYRLAGLGMNKDANYSKDRFDDMTVPRFVKYLEINFKHPEYFAPDFTKDIRPIEPNQTWEFTVESNLTPQAIELQWDKYLSDQFDLSQKLMLLDQTHNKVIDLTRQNNYSFQQDTLSAFKLYYGSMAYIQEHLQSFRTELSENYPNPFRQETTISFILSQNETAYDIKLQVYTIAGQLVTTLAEGTFASGAHQVIWDGRDASGKKLPAGMYLYKLDAVSAGGMKSFIKKMAIQ